MSGLLIDRPSSVAYREAAPADLADDPDEAGPPPDDGWDDDGDDADEGGGGDGEPARWVTIATFWQTTEAHIARVCIEAEGIDCFLADEYLIAADWLLANAAGGIKLQVPQPHAVRAAKLLALARVSGAPTDHSSEPMFDGQRLCPRCGGDDLHTVRLSRRLAFLTLLLLGAPLPILRRRKQCAECGFEWA